MNAQARRREPLLRGVRRNRSEQLLIGLELFIGVTAMLGGIGLIVRPDGTLLQAKLSALSGTPFADWRVPGVFLLVFVGGGSLLTGFWLWRRAWHARELAVLAGLGVLAFEIVELTTIGFQALEAAVGLLAVLMVALAWRFTQPKPRINQSH